MKGPRKPKESEETVGKRYIKHLLAQGKTDEEIMAIARSDVK